MRHYHIFFSAILFFTQPGLGQVGKRVELENELLKIAFNSPTKTWSLFEREGENWLPVIDGASATVSFRDRDSLLMHRSTGVPATKILPYQDRLGKGRKLDVRIPDGEIEWSLTFVLYEKKNSGLISLRVRNASTLPLELKEVKTIELHGASSFQFSSSNVLMHVHGYQSWNTPEVVSLDSVSNPTSYWSTIFYEPDAWKSVLFGFLTNTHATNSLRISEFSPAQAIARFAAASDFRGVVLQPGDTLATDALYYSLQQSPHENLTEYAEAVQISSPSVRKPFVPLRNLPLTVEPGSFVPTGWSSWYYYYQDIGEDSIIRNLNAAVKHFKKAGLKYIQIDDGFQITAGDWNTNKRFPHGHKWLTEQIHSKGFMAGLWVAPFAVAESSSLYKNHRSWLLRDERDSLKEFFTNDWWGGRIFSLDPTIPEVQEWLEELFFTITTRWGYDYVKIDFLYLAAEGGMYRKNVSPTQAYRMGLDAVRKGVGSERFILGSGAPVGSSIGYIDGMRIGPDVHAGWSGVVTGMSAVSERYFYHQTCWYNDPDCLLVREPLTTEQARAWASVVALSGQMNILSDNLSDLPQERIDLLRMTLPSYGVSATPVDLFTTNESGGLIAATKEGASIHTPPPEILNLQVSRKFENWNVIGIYNWSLQESEKLLTVRKLGLPQGKSYLVYELWTDQFLGEMKGELRITLPPTSSRILSIHEKKDHPIILSTRRHITQGAVDLADVTWDPRLRMLSGAAKGILGGNYELILYIPVGMNLGPISTAARTTVLPVGENGVKIHFTGISGDKLAWKIRFP